MIGEITAAPRAEIPHDARAARVDAALVRRLLGALAMRSLAVLLPAIALAACSGAPPAPSPSPEATETTAAALSQCVGATVKGVDVYDNDLPIDWNQLHGEGYDFAIVKASESTYDDQNGQFPSSYAGARAAGLIVGSYHFFRGDTDGVAQANWFLSIAGPHLQAQDLPPALDIETTDGASGSEITKRMWDWIHTVEQKTGKKPMVYTYSSYFSGAGVDTTGLDKYPLWIAPANSGATCFDTGGYSLPWSSATFWQYDTSSPLGGISNTAADHDKFIGTLQQLQAFAQGSAAAPPAQVNGNGAMSAVQWPSDGHLEVFATSAGGAAAEHVYTKGASTTWSAAQTYSGAAGCGAASAVWGEPTGGDAAQVVAPAPGDGGGDSEEAHMLPAQKGQWSAFGDFGGKGLTGLAAAVAGGSVDVFALAPDGSIEENARDVAKGTWSGWKSVGGHVATGAAPIVHADGSVEVFATDSAGAAWHAVESKGAWGAWKSLGGALASRPVPVRYPDGHLEVFARGADGHAWTSEFAGGAWPAFTSIEKATAVAGDVAAVMNQDGRPELFARAAADGTVLHMWWDATKKTWTAWQPLGKAQVAASDPLGFVRGDGTADVLAVDAAGGLLVIHRDAHEAWGAWQTIATGVDPCVAAAGPADGGAGGGSGGGGRGADGGAGGGPVGAGDGGDSWNPAAGGGHGCSVDPAIAPRDGAWLAAAALAMLGLRRRRAVSRRRPFLRLLLLRIPRARPRTAPRSS